MNKILLSGNLCKDIELKYTSTQKAYTKNTIAVKRKYKTNGEYETDFVNIQLWGAQAEYLYNYGGKGSKVLLSGELQIRSYDSNGEKKYITEINANEIELLGSKDNSDNKIKKENDLFDGFNKQTTITDDDLPF